MINERRDERAREENITHVENLLESSDGIERQSFPRLSDERLLGIVLRDDGDSTRESVGSKSESFQEVSEDPVWEEGGGDLSEHGSFVRQEEKERGSPSQYSSPFP